MTPVIELQNASKEYPGGVRALRLASLTVGAGVNQFGSPAVARSDNGNTVVVWAGPNPGDPLYARLYNPAGAALTRPAGTTTYSAAPAMHDAADLVVELEEGGELRPGVGPQPDDGRVLAFPLGGELGERDGGGDAVSERPGRGRDALADLRVQALAHEAGL